MNKTVLALVAALCLIVVGIVPTYFYMRSEVDAMSAKLDMANSQMHANARAYSEEYAKRTEAEKRYAQKNKELSLALKAHKDWADGLVPDAVYRSLFK